MPWKSVNKVEQCEAFIRARRDAGRGSIAELCRGFGITRQCGSKWWNRYLQEGGLKDRSRTTHRAQKLKEKWHALVLGKRRSFSKWGARKLRQLLQDDHPHAAVPSPRAIARWLNQAGVQRAKKHRAKPGPVLKPAGQIVARRPNQVWTIDFKGWFYTGDGKRVMALTIRDLATRYILAVRHVRPRDHEVRNAITRVFRRHGLPTAIQADNGPPFGSKGPRGWSVLSTWWVMLGIKVQFSRPGCPGDNAEHEQMHWVLKNETAMPPARTLRAQQQRFDRWRNRYNHVRPHESLKMRRPGELYLKSARRFCNDIAPPVYPRTYDCLGLDHRGRLFWRNRRRVIGRAFPGQTVGLKTITPDHCEVYLYKHLLGTLHAKDLAGLRPVCWRCPTHPKGEGAAPPPSTLPTY
jgi:putative transposase